MESGEAAGLVYNLTSDKRFRINQHDARLKRTKRSVITSARLHQEAVNAAPYRCRPIMLTLTYASDMQWGPRHISEFVKHVREYLRRRGYAFRFVWCLETTKRGVPHYHVVVWLPYSVRLPKPDQQGWWPYGMTKVEVARNAVGYIAKYVSKGADGSLPRGARLHGAGGLSALARMERRWWLAPSYVRKWWQDWHIDVRRAAGGGWTALKTGEWRPSLYRFVSFGSGYVEVIRLEECDAIPA